MGRFGRRKWRRLAELLRLDTCFWIRYKINGPKAGTTPKVIGLLTSEDRELDSFKSRTVSAEVRHGRYRRSNRLRTYKYTLWDFFPRAVLIQFKRFANTFYLCLMIITAIGFFSNNTVFFVSFSPVSILVVVAVVVAVTVLIEGLNDVTRHLADRKANRKSVEKLARDGDFQVVQSGDLRPGDIVRIRSREEFPADCLLIATECFSGVCYIETSEIDGETNLKIKEVPKSFVDEITQICEEALDMDLALSMDETTVRESPQEGNGSAVSLKREDEKSEEVKLCSALESVQVRRRLVECTQGLFEYEEPNAFLQFNGRFMNEQEATMPLDFSNLVLRGSVLRNTKWVLGVIMYAGAETKIVMSKGDTPQKYGLQDGMVNLMLYCVFIMYVILCVIFALLITFAVPDTAQFWYFMNTSSTTTFLLPVFWAFLFTYAVLLAQFIPITIYLCVEVAAFFQQYLIHHDLDMYHPLTNTAAACRSSGLVTEIGQVTHIFSDKTGTLTNNNMVLIGFYAGGAMHGYIPKKARVRSPGQSQPPPRFRSSAANDGLEEKEENSEGSEGTGPSHVNVAELFSETLQVLVTTDDYKFNEAYLAEMALKRTPIREFLMLIAVCHTVVIETEEDGSIQYNTEGPDEEALVSFAAKMGFELISTSNGQFTIHETAAGTVTHHKLLALNPFDSTRKRMSAVVQRKNLVTGKDEVVLLIKGADNVVFERLRSGQEEERKQVEDALRTYSWSGLRTLVMGKRVLDEDEFRSWKQRYAAATDLPGAERVSTILMLADEIERDLELVGASAIEDELQDGVPETIASLREAGIRIWVATGDKLETAVNIALAANLLDEEMLQVVLQETDRMKLKQKLLSATSLIVQSIEGDLPKPSGQRDGDSVGGNHFVELERGRVEGEEKGMEIPKGYLLDVLALLVTGDALEQLLQKEKGDEEIERMFLQVANACKIILACRVSPKQKALLVKLVGKASVVDLNSPVTLAIGDGANDVPMIQAARIGVGISGREGMQAANSADFSLAQFKFLKKLLLVHGHWNYRRGAMLVTYVTYSQIVFTFELAFFLTVSLFSGQQAIVNPVYAVSYGYLANIPIIFTAMFNKDVTAHLLLENPWTYAVGRKREELNVRTSMVMLGRSLLHSAIIWIGVILGLPLATGLEAMGATMFTSIMVLMFHQQIKLTSPHNYITVSIYIIFIAAFLLFMTYVDSTPFLWNAFWVVGTIAMIDFALSFLRGQYLATPLQVLSEMSLLESNDDVKQVLKQAGEALTLPIRVPAKVVLDTLRELEEKAPGNISVLPKKTQTSFTFDFTSIGIGALLPIKALTKRKPKRGHAKGDEGASEEMVKDSLDSSRSGKGLQHHESSMHVSAVKRFTFSDLPPIQFVKDTLGKSHRKAKKESATDAKAAEEAVTESMKEEGGEGDTTKASEDEVEESVENT